MAPPPAAGVLSVLPKPENDEAEVTAGAPKEKVDEAVVLAADPKVKVEFEAEAVVEAVPKAGGAEVVVAPKAGAAPALPNVDAEVVAAPNAGGAEVPKVGAEVEAAEADPKLKLGAEVVVGATKVEVAVLEAAVVVAEPKEKFAALEAAPPKLKVLVDVLGTVEAVVTEPNPDNAGFAASLVVAPNEKLGFAASDDPKVNVELAVVVVAAVEAAEAVEVAKEKDGGDFATGAL